MRRILIVEDSPTIAATVREHLAAEGYQADVAGTAAEARTLIASVEPDLVILDLMLPDEPGESILSWMRSGGSCASVLILSAKSDEMSKVRGFRAGADDYLTKPFGLLELLARVDNLIRRAHSGTRGRKEICFGEVTVRPAGRVVTVAGTPIDLRPREFELLLALLGRPGQVWSRRELLDAVWGYDPAVESRTVDWHIAELRGKIEPNQADPSYIKTVRKVGYRFEPPNA